MLQEAKDYLLTRKRLNLLIILINTAVFIYLSFSGDTEDALFMYHHGGCYTPAVLDGEYWRVLTAVFLHFGLPHLLYNMLCLLVIGDRVETVFGPVRYLLVFVLGGIAGNAVTVWTEIRSGDYAVSAGASGAAFALIGAMAVFILANRKRFGSMMVRRVFFVAVLMLAEGFSTEGTNNIAHLAGAAAGMLLAGVFLLGSRIRQGRK